MGEPDLLTVLSPVVYDEIGINLCRGIPVKMPSNTDFATVQVLNVSFNSESGKKTSICPIDGKPNCYSVVLTNLKVTFAINLYDSRKNLIETVVKTVVYLPPEGSPEYGYFDPETNPECIEVILFAPYGISQHLNNNAITPVINYVGFTTKSNTVTQGLNLIAYPKIIDLDVQGDFITIGLSLYLKTIYFSQYRFNHKGKAIVPKACDLTDEGSSSCLDFVNGDLLNMCIKPLEFCPPKKDCGCHKDCYGLSAW